MTGKLVGTSCPALSPDSTYKLFEVQPTDPLTLAAASAVVVLVTLLASYVPARRASRLNPLTALRHE